MELRWTELAAADLEQIANYLFEKTPIHADRLVNELYTAPFRLLKFPFMGRAGKRRNTRELIVSSLPYIVVYNVVDNVVYVIRILHGAQKWP